jgi:hypothetical protein
MHAAAAALAGEITHNGNPFERASEKKFTLTGPLASK